jgi:UDP-N-acetylmuramyl pentapeptide phosphotransferase/UDP-N-acetylglucosamine-1-phosphate transferase
MADGFARAVIGAVTLSFVFVGLVRQLALRHGVLDHPTERSSHATATPRGGGLGLIVAVLLLAASPVGPSAEWPTILLLVGGGAIAAVGWLDDRRGLTVRSRLAVHLAGGLLVGLVAASNAGSATTRVLLFACWTFWTVSSVNFVNFMDGINGLVASQVAIFAFSLALLSGAGAGVGVLAALLGAACLGFLPWNFPRAKVFLGDVGSGALGYLVPALALLGKRADTIGIVQAHLPLLPLYFDAIWTVARRWRAGERLTTAHRNHLYQRLANGGLGHTAVTAIYAIAALLGAVAARFGRAWLSPWTALYVCTITVAGMLLHRYAVRSSAVS